MGWTSTLSATDRLRIAPDTKAVRLTVPSIVGVDEPFDLHLGAFRRDGLPHLDSRVAVRFRNEWVPASGGDIRGLPADVQFSPSDEGVLRIPGLRFPAPGVYTITAAVPDLPRGWGSAPCLIVNSNPVWVQPAVDQRIYWGDIHVHSALGDCHRHTTKSIEFLFRFAREVAALDFASAADHVEQLTPEKWQTYWETAGRHNKPGSFAAFLGYEYTHIRGPEKQAGHMNVYFRGNGARRFADVSDDYHRFYETKRRHTIEEIWSYLDRFRERLGDDYITAIHHPCWEHHMPLQGQDGSYNDERMPIIEVWSKWGSSLCADHPNRLWRSVGPASGYAHDALARGYRLGFIASSDCHNTCPHGEMGHLEPSTGQHVFYEHGGLAGVWARELTREGIFDALRARRCLGTSWSRLPIDVTINGHAMGSVVERADDRPRELKASILATMPGVRVEIVRNGAVVWSDYPKPVDGTRYEVEWRDDASLESIHMTPPATSGRPPFTYYYVRVIQENGPQAWASPVWFLSE